MSKVPEAGIHPVSLSRSDIATREGDGESAGAVDAAEGFDGLLTPCLPVHPNSGSVALYPLRVHHLCPYTQRLWDLERSKRRRERRGKTVAQLGLGGSTK